jgi:hypothetical protein
MHMDHGMPGMDHGHGGMDMGGQCNMNVCTCLLLGLINHVLTEIMIR